MRDYHPVDVYWLPHTMILSGVLALALAPFVPMPWTIAPALSLGTLLGHLLADRFAARPSGWRNAMMGAFVGAAGGALGALLITVTFG